MNKYQNIALKRPFIALMLIIMVLIVSACGGDQTVYMDQETQCTINGGQWRTWIADDIDGNVVEIGGACDCLGNRSCMNEF